jgi:DNA-binding transcriptional ArsR family regulator
MISFMKVAPPLLSPILRSDTQGRVLAQLFSHPDHEFTVTELTNRARATMPTVLRDLDRLTDLGYLTERRVGRNRLMRVNPEHPLYSELRDIVLYGYGPEPVLTDLIRELPNVESAVIYGSWAARAAGEPGKDPNDIDVLLVGSIDPGATYDAARRATALLRREVTFTVVSPERWAADADGFIETVKSRPRVHLAISGELDDTVGQGQR